MSENNIIKAALEKLEEQAKNTPSAKVFAEYLKNKCQSDLELAKNIIDKGKTLKGLTEYITAEAKKKASGGFSMIEDEVVFKWTENYFGIDKPTISEDDVSAAAHAIKQGANTTNNHTVKKPSIEHKKPKTTESDNQISLLDMM